MTARRTDPGGAPTPKHRATASFLQAVDVWRRLPPEVLTDALDCMTRVRVLRREALWSPGEPAHCLYVVRSGVIRIDRPAPPADGLTLVLYGRGDICGEVGALAASLGASSVRDTFAIAHEDVVVLAMPTPSLADLMKVHVEVGAELAALVTSRRAAIETRLVRLPHQSVAERLECALQALAPRFGISDSRGILLNVRLTHRDLASIVGSTRETVSACLARWRRSGRLEVDGRRFVLPWVEDSAMAGRRTPHILRAACAGPDPEHGAALQPVATSNGR